MKKELTALCIALAALSGCSSDETTAQKANDFSTQSAALFDEIGGEPWGDIETATVLQSTSPKSGMKFSRTIGSGDFNANGGIDIVSSEGSIGSKGTLTFKWDNAVTPEPHTFTSGDESDNFGAAMATGKLCPSLSSYDMILASAPSYSNFSGGFALMYAKKSGRFNIMNVQKRFFSGTEREMAGMHLAVGDINGDGKMDLVYQSTPLSAAFEYLAPEIKVVLDFCSLPDNATVSPAASITGDSSNSLLGNSIYIADLDGKGQNEIIIVDPNYIRPGNDEFSANGAIHFYKFESGVLRESRNPIIGDENSSSAATITSVAFSDIDGDGDLDLIVGEPMFNTMAKREGRVRTYTNPGNGGSFRNEIQWSYSTGHGNTRFGSSLQVADLNGDGVNDLIVGAPGKRAASSVDDKAQGGVYVFMGTKDGSVFSKKPFWNVTSTVSTIMNDAFGQSMLAANMDNAGWLDILVAAPGSGTSTDSLDQGQIHIFKNSVAHCYTADRCLVDNVCYENNAVSADSMCMTCQPDKDNFGFSDLVCEEKETDCQVGATCDPQKGCMLADKPDGTECGTNTCNENTLSLFACKAGVCESTDAECGNYVCDASLSICPTTCSSDADCTNDTKCVNGKCEIINLPPVVTLEDHFSGLQGTTVTLTATASDPENDTLTSNWECTTNSSLKFDFKVIDTNTATLTIPAQEASTTTYNCSVVYTDTANNTTKAETVVAVQPVAVTLDTPADQSIHDTPEIQFTGTTTGKGEINVVSGDNILCTSPISRLGRWDCIAKLEPGNYDIHAEWSSNSNQQSSSISITVNAPEPNNNPPVLIMDNADIYALAGEIVNFDASRSYDPDDNDEIVSYKWKTDPDDIISSLSGSDKPTASFTVPETAEPETTYTFTLTIADSHGAEAATNIHVIVAGTFITVNAPAQDEVVTTSTVDVSGTTNINEGHILVTDESSTLCIAEIVVAPDSNVNTWSCTFEAHNGDYEIVPSWQEQPEGHSVHTEPVSFTVNITEPDTLEFTSPTEGQELPAGEIVFSGTTTYNWFDVIHIYEKSSSSNNLLCDAKVTYLNDRKGEWSCTATMTAGNYTVLAGHDLIDAGPAWAEVSFTVTAPEGVYPVITSPKESETISIRPTVSGTVNATEGKVNVWTEIPGSSVSQLICTADVKSDGTWACTAGFDLEYDTSYAITANWQNGSLDGKLSSPVLVKTQGKEASPITILTPANGIKIDAANPVIYAGTAAPGTLVHVYVSQKDNKNDASRRCEVTANALGNWACPDDFLGIGDYVAYADDASDDTIIPSHSVEFSVIMGTVIHEEKNGNVKGGSCSLSTAPASHFGWMFLLAGFAGFGLIRRRKDA